MHPTLRPLSVLLFASALSAQLPLDSWLVGTIASGKLAWISPDLQTLVVPQPQTLAMVNTNALAVDEAGVVYYGTTSATTGAPGALFRVVVAGNTILQETQLAGPVAASAVSVNGLALRGNELWYCASNGDIGWVDRSTPNQTPTVAFNLNAGAGITGGGNALATDGREIFVGTTGTALPFNVWGLDVSGPTPVWRGIANVQVPGSSSNAMAQLSIGRDGRIVAATFGGWFAEIDPVAGAWTTLNTALSPQGRLNAGAINPWTNVLGAGTGASSTPRQIDFYDVASATWASNQHSASPDVPAAINPVCPTPFELYGRGCDNATGRDARIGWTGLPAAGTTFTVTLRDAEPLGIAILWLGLSDTMSGFGPLPLDAAIFGAPGCRLYASADATFVALLQNGTASQGIRLPATPSFLGSVLFGQWGASSTVNAFGLVSSDAVRIRLR